MLEIILGCIILVAFIILVIIIYNNKFQYSIIKIDEAENNIDILLQKKLDLLKKIKPLVIKTTKDDDFLNDIDNIKISSMDHFNLHNLLKNDYNSLFQLLDDNEKLYKKKNVLSTVEAINENELELIAAIKFYNDSVVIYNQLIVSFPSNIVRLFFGYKKREFYKNEKREIFEILKEK